MNPLASIYCYRDLSGVILYVGCSLNPTARFGYHRRSQKRRFGKAIRGARICILREAREPDCWRIESQIIKALKRRGQAKFNTKTSIQGVGRSNHISVLWVEKGVVLKSFASVARAVGGFTSAQWVRRELESGGDSEIEMATGKTMKLIIQPMG